jgi:hypothetical protein
MSRIAPALLILVQLAGVASTCHATPATMYFDVVNAPDHASSLPPHYAGGADLLVAATPLLAHGVSPSYDCCIDGPGDFIFVGWGVKEQPVNYSKYIEFNVTALAPVTFATLKFTGFGGLWSNMGGPRAVFFGASRDGFVANVTEYWVNPMWNMQQTSPYITDSPNDFVYDVSGLGLLQTGQTMSFRFYFTCSDYGHIAGGFWNKSPNDYNPTLVFGSGAVPVTPTSWGTVKALYH